MAAPKMTRHQMKQDELTTALEHAGGYLKTHPAALRNGGIAAGALALVGVVAYFALAGRGEAAAALLAEGQTRLEAAVVPSSANPAGKIPSYPSEAERDRAALDSFTRLVSSYGARQEGRLGLYYQGILLARLGRSEEAESVLERVASDPASPLIGAMARAQLAQVKAQRGDLEGAVKLYTELSELKDGSYPRDWALYYLADALGRQGKEPEARAALQKIASEFPASPFASEATRRLSAQRSS